MATQFYAHSETFRPPSPTDSGNGQAENSWYRHSSQTGDVSSGRSTSPGSSNRRSLLFNEGKSASSIDPRRITPTLHASLVSEILSLRRELENKTAFIDDLETNLHASKIENEDINDRLSQLIRESKANKKQSDDAEKHLYQVTEDLIKERDEAVNTGHDLRNKLNALTSRSRRQEQEFEQWQRDWERKNNSWEAEKRGLELRVQTTETQLRTVVQEISAKNDSARGTKQKVSIDSGFGNDSPFASPASQKPRHRRNVSSMSGQSETFLVSTPPRNQTTAFFAGKTLADEMESIDDDEDLDLRRMTSNEDSLLGMTPTRSVESPSKARKVLGLDAPKSNEEVLADPELITEPSSGVPSSRARNHTTADDYFSAWRKAQQQHPQTTHATASSMVSASTQTEHAQEDREHDIPDHKESEIPHLTISTAGLEVNEPSGGDDGTTKAPPTSYQDASTQYDPEELPAIELTPHTPVTETEKFTVPHIAIHPPSTAPPSPRTSTVLPPQSVSVSTQTDPRMTSTSVDAEIQTEEIRIDLRKFRAHLQVDDDDLSKTSQTRPTSYESRFSRDTIPSVSVQEMATSFETQAIKDTVERSGLAKSPEFNESRNSGDLQTQSSFWGGHSARSSGLLMSLHDDQGIKSGQSSMLARGLRKSQTSEPSATNESYALPAVPQSQHQNNISNRNSNRDNDEHWSSIRNSDLADDRDSATLGMRTSFRSRASSVDTVDSSIFSVGSLPPPIPVPDRSSSRVHADILEEEGSESGYDGSPKRRAPLHSSSRPSGVRKTRSSNSIRRTAQYSPKRRRRAATRLAPIQSIAYENDMDEEYNPYTPIQENHTNSTASAAPSHSPNEMQDDRDSPLVDSIAAAMVGEWMWKYPQKRKSFGMVDSGKEFGSDNKDTIRQKRWVWISPYERTVMWSSKQPVGGNQLMGSKGRKLTIKTVLDVADPSPLPKGSNYATCFSRSIVILTPDRPLKLTAPNRDRHYHWLLALSFLANPSQGMPTIPRVPQRKTDKRDRQPGQLQNHVSGHNRSDTAEHNDNVISASVSKATASQLGVHIPQGRNFSAPASTHPYNNSNLGSRNRIPKSPSEASYSVVSGPPATSLNTLMYDHPDMPMDIPDIQTHRFRRGSNVSSLHSHTKQSQGNRRDSHSHSNPSPNDLNSDRLPSFTTNTQQPTALNPTAPLTHTRRRSNTNPIRLPTSLSNLKSLSSRTRTTPTSPPLSPTPSASQTAPTASSSERSSSRTPSTMRMTAFIDPSLPYNNTAPLSPGLSRPLPPSAEELSSGTVRDRRPSVQSANSGSGVPGQGNRTPLINAHFPGFEARSPRLPTPSPLPSPRIPDQQNRGGNSSSATAGSTASGAGQNAGLGLGLSLDTTSLMGTETAVQGGTQGTWRRSFHPAAVSPVSASGGGSPLDRNGAFGGMERGRSDVNGGGQQQQAGSRGYAISTANSNGNANGAANGNGRAGSGLGNGLGLGGIVTGLRRKGMRGDSRTRGQEGADGEGSIRSGIGGGGAMSIRSVAPSVASNGTRGTEEKKRLGYVFDEEGRDPFRGF
ncbi:Nuclear migration protein NUM1 [Elsinoe australis]|uniref:Nuclear migration protein NUM1 n=1 Tax=Elsinoe australis TaxID=40998 RepID=A0A2P8A8V5_9PEZI|nr:Nuclear migration protein NUM1 [Elsinoe australis]